MTSFFAIGCVFISVEQRTDPRRLLRNRPARTMASTLLLLLIMTDSQSVKPKRVIKLTAKALAEKLEMLQEKKKN